MASELTDAVNEIFRDMSDPDAAEGGTGVFWEQFKLLEISGFDVSVVRPWIVGFIARWRDSNSGSSFTPEGNEKAIAFELRNIARQQAGIPKLQSHEEQSWKFDDPSYKEYIWDGIFPNIGAFDSGSGKCIIDKIVLELEKNHSDALRFAKLAKAHNESIRSHGLHKSRFVYNTWITDLIVSCATEILGNYSSWPPFQIVLKVSERLDLYGDC